MAEHYTSNTESVTRWCNHCGKPTQHSVSGGRVGRCMEHDAPALSKAQEKRREKRERQTPEPGLFLCALCVLCGEAWRLLC